MELPDAMTGIMDGRELHPDAHITEEMISSLKYFIWAGFPSDWMEECMLGVEGIGLELLPPEFLELHNRLSANQGAIDDYLSGMTKFANQGDPDSAPMRRGYQTNENRIMRFVLESIKDLIPDREGTKLLLALRGAKFFQPLLKDLVGSSAETEVKRIRLEAKPEEAGTPFLVGLGELPTPDQAEIERVKTLLMPDDCLSTFMTQLALLEKALELGYRPDNVIMIFTVGTVGGIAYAYKKFDELMKRYALNCKLNLQCGGICYWVNDEMYLVTEDGLQMVGDMGKWNRPVEN